MTDDTLKLLLKAVRDASQHLESEIQETIDAINQRGDDDVAGCMDNVEIKHEVLTGAVKKLFRAWRKPHCQHKHWAIENDAMTCMGCGSSARSDYEWAWDKYFSKHQGDSRNV